MRSNGKGNRLIGRRMMIFVMAMLCSLLAGLFVISFAARAALVTKTWDGGGATNNWSDAANWSGDTVPGSSDDIVFDSTSVKDVTIDVGIAVASIKIDSGYTGTVTQSDAASITVSGCNGKPCFLQNNGTFNGSSNTITLTAGGFGALTMNGGTFNGGGGDILLAGVSTENPGLTMLGGLFKSTSGNLTTSGSIVSGGTSAFQNNGGTVTLTASGPFQGISGDSNHLSILFNDLNVNLADGAALLVGPRVIVAGNLALNNGTLNQNGSVIEARSGLTIAPNFDGGVISLELANGAGPRTFTFTPDLNLPKIVVNDPNVTINTSGAGALTFPHQLILGAGIFNQGNDLIINAVGIGGGFCLIQNGGTFNGSSNTITLNSNGFGSLNINGGTFNGGTGDINLVGAPSDNPGLSLLGGTFRSTSGNLTVPGLFRFQGVGTSFLHNGGTVTLTAGGQNGFLVADSNHPTINFNNLNLNALDGVNYDFGARAIVEGTLALNDGRIGSGNSGTVIEARGGVFISPNFDGGIGAIEFANGAGPRAFTFATGLNLPMIVVNDPNVTINTSGVGTLSFAHELILRQGIVNQGGVELLIDSQGLGNTSYQQTGGTFNGSSNTITIHSVGFGAATITGGSFNGGTGDINLVGLPADNPGLSLQGGTFQSTSGNLTVPGNFRFQGFGTGFLHNNGTVNLTAGQNTFFSNDADHPSITFNNLNIDLANNANLGLGPILIVGGNLSLNDGSVGQAGTTIEARGQTVIGPNFDGGPTNITFAGASSQTFTNNGGTNPTGTWIVNKPSGIVTAASGVILQPTQPLNITSGTLFLGSNSNLTSGAITIGSLGKLAADSSQTITLGGNLNNNGSISFQGNGAGCPDSDTILIRSSFPGTQRLWSGSGGFLLADVDIQDQAGSASITVFSGTNSGNSGANFSFNASCPTALGISPLTASIVAGTTRIFESSGGIGGRQFSFVANNSGASLTASGAYTAGVVQHVTDTIRVTDSVGNFADASAFVVGPASKMAFVQQPTTTGVGSSISPPIRVAIQDQAGFTVESATNTIVLTILNNPSGGTLSGTTARNPVGGVATFDNISIDQIGTGYTLRAGANPSSIQRPTSDPFDIVAAAPAGLVFIVQPQDVITGQPIAPAVQIAVVDGFGNIVTNATNPVTVAIANNPGSSTLFGTSTLNAVNGVATFSDLSLNNPGTGYTLSVTSSSLNGATSAGFNAATPFTVTNTNDSGTGSLRQAILNSNSTPGFQTIDFSIQGNAPFNIAIQSNLPDITDPVIIDGATQPGFAGSPIVQIDVRTVLVTPPGTNPHAFKIRGGNTTVRGFSMFGYHNATSDASAIFIDTNGGNSVEGNWIGLDAAGNVFQSDTGFVILSANNTIGGAQISQRNVISGNQRSAINVALPATNTLIKGNFIGTDPTGSTARSNGSGISIAKSSIVDGNVISGNTSIGIAAGPDNIISGNLIGLAANGTAALGNGGAGVLVRNASSQVLITGNRIFANQGLGIQLGDRTGSPNVLPLPNDPQDFDLGANAQQNFPVLTSASTSAGSTQVSATLNSVPERDYTIELFSSAVCDASGNGEGETLLGSTTVATDAGGIAAFSVPLPTAVPTGRFITATATDSGGNTSEFSSCTRVAVRHTISGRITRSGQPEANVRVFVTGPGINIQTLTNSNGDYAVSNLPEGFAYVVTPQKAGLTFTPAQAGDNNLVTDRVINFTAVQNRFSISGRVVANVLVSLSANAAVRRRGGDTIVQAAVSSGPFGLATVRMSLTGPTPAAFSTDFSGNYSLSGLLPGDYTLTPSKANYTFNPPSVSFTITAQDVREDFTGDSPGLDLLTGRITFDTLGSIKAINANGSGLVTEVSVNRFTSFSEPNVTPNGLKITGVSSLPSNIFTANSDGTGRLNVRRASGLHSPAWSPNGSKIAFFDSVSQTLKTMNANGSGVTSVSSNCTNPDWGPDNTNIVCIRDRSLVATQSGILFNSPFNLSSPKFSPDGSKIALINGGAIEVMNSNGTSRTTIVPRDTFGSISYLGLAWSPDGTRLAFVKRFCGGNGQCVKRLIAIFPTSDTSQQGQLTIDDDFAGTNIDWSLSPGVSTPSGSNVTVEAGGANITFPAVGSAGATNIIPISPASAGLLPNGFVVGSQAFDISTTASFTPLITVCFTMPSNTTLTQFNQTFLLHNENGVLVNRTMSRNFAAKQICGQVASLSPFVLGEQVDPLLPSITGVVLDTDGNPISDVPVLLSGAEDRMTTTDVDGQFEFANLGEGGNYNVQPKQPSLVFTEYSQDFVNLSGENTIVFSGSPASFSLSGNIANSESTVISGVTVSLNGASSGTVFTDSSGNYTFTDLPADGIFSISAFNGANGFTPQELTVGPLLGDVTDLNFTALAPTAGGASITGQVKTANGLGIRNLTLTLTDMRGRMRTATTSGFGYFSFEGLPAGQAYVLSASSKKYMLKNMPRVLSIDQDLGGLEITADQ